MSVVDRVVAIVETTTSTIIGTGSSDVDRTKPLNEIVFITLGDGDFTWSLDLGRYLLWLWSTTTATTTTTLPTMKDVVKDETTTVLPPECKSIRLIVTGIDSLNGFQQKYRNYKYTLRELDQLNTKSPTTVDRHNNNNNSNCGCQIQVEVHHEVNAIISCTSNSTHIPRGHVIIFHHPHLGIEDAKLHHQFLCHLFHSVQQYWMLPSIMVSGGGVFHLTLANGQYDRWECHTAAQRNGMKLVQQSIFVANPSIVGWPTTTTTTYYKQRRHQTGKSFASRTSGSTTYTFIRESDDDTNTGIIHSLLQIRLPWFVSNDIRKSDEISAIPSTSFTCTICDKQFREARSLKNHMTSVHSNNKRKRSETDIATFICHLCQARSFHSSEALHDHMIAKHNGIHSTIVPNNGLTRHTAVSSTDQCHDLKTTPHPDGNCSICDAVLTSSNDITHHYKSFIPSLADTNNKVEMRECQFCRKSFHQVRAQQQHENFCSLRRQQQLQQQNDLDKDEKA
jgi:hypothetical protein